MKEEGRQFSRDRLSRGLAPGQLCWEREKVAARLGRLAERSPVVGSKLSRFQEPGLGLQRPHQESPPSRAAANSSHIPSNLSFRKCRAEGSLVGMSAGADRIPVTCCRRVSPDGRGAADANRAAPQHRLLSCAGLHPRAECPWPCAAIGRPRGPEPKAKPDGRSLQAQRPDIARDPRTDTREPDCPCARPEALSRDGTRRATY